MNHVGFGEGELGVLAGFSTTGMPAEALLHGLGIVSKTRPFLK